MLLLIESFEKKKKDRITMVYNQTTDYNWLQLQCNVISAGHLNEIKIY